MSSFEYDKMSNVFIGLINDKESNDMQQSLFYSDIVYYSKCINCELIILEYPKWA